MADGFHPFTDPYLRAQEMHDYAQSLRFKRELQDHQRQQWQAEMEQTKRQNLMQDYMTSMALHSMGALPAEAGASASRDAGLRAAASIAPEDARPLMQTPVGDYRLPNRGDKTAKMIGDETAAGTAEGYKEQAKKNVYDPDEDFNLGPRYGNRTIKVPRSKVPDLIKTLNPKWEMKESTGDQGDVTRVWYDDRGNEMHRTVEKGAGKSARINTAAGAHPYIANQAEERKKLADEWRPGVYAQFGITPEVEKQAAGNVIIGYTETDHLPIYDTEGQKEASAKIQHANSELDKAITRELENRARAPKTQGAGAQPQAKTAAPPSSVKASELDEVLKRANTKRAAQGLPRLDMNGLRKQLAANKVTITEGQ